MQINTSPCTVFSIQQLVLLRKFLSVFRNVSSICAAPVLNYIPVGSFTTVAGGDDTHRTCCRVHFANDFTAFLCKFTRQCTFILQSPYHYRRRITAFLHPLTKQLFKVLSKLRCVIPYMGRKLCPEQDAFFVPIFLIIEMMGLMSITEGVEACRTYLFHSRSYLLPTEGMTLPELMLILAYTIDKDRLSIQIETPIFVISLYRPTDCTDTERRRDLIRCLGITLNHTCQFIKIGILRIP